MNGKTRENWLKNSADVKFTLGNISYLYAHSNSNCKALKYSER